MEIATQHDYIDRTYSVSHDDDVEATVRGIENLYQQASDLTPTVDGYVPSDPGHARAMLEESYGPEWTRHFADAVEQVFGVEIIKLRLPGSNGLSLSLPNAKVIVVPTEVSWARQSWTIAHELGHVAADDFTPLDGGPGAGGEKAANRYAAELLLPASLMRGISWGQIEEKELGRFLWESGVSLDALRIRLRALKLPLPATERTLWSLVRVHVAAPSPFHDFVVERQQESAARRFPARLISAHEINGKSPRSLAWMLGAPIESGQEGGEVDDAPSAAEHGRTYGAGGQEPG